MIPVKTAVVTGANKGIGREVARRLATDGFKVWLGARDAVRGTQAAEEMQAEGLDVRWLEIDVTRDEGVAAAARTVGNESPRLDVLVNNAGGRRTVQQAAQIIVRLAELEADGPTGGYFDDGGQVPW